ncbi:MAG: MBL fold metallo-hydrolase [Hasllibacter sp.]
MADRLVLLGTKGGPAIRPGGPMPTSTLLEIAGRRLVIDCGLGVTRALVEAGLDLRDGIDAILITHLHSDHVLELGPLLHTAWTSGLSAPVRVLGPPGLRALWDGFAASLAYDIDLRIADEGRPDLRALVAVDEIDEGPLGLPGLDAAALRVPHPPVRDAFAFRVGDGGWSVCLSGDTARHPPLAAFARGCDVLVHEAMLTAGVDAIVAKAGGGPRLRAHILAAHTGAADAARIAADAGAARLVLNHLIPTGLPGFGEDDWRAAAAAFPGEVIVGRDGLVVPR